MGSEIKDKLGSVALWLYDHKVNIKVIEIELFRDGENTFLQPQVIIPLPVSRFTETGRNLQPTSALWMADGKAWHLDKRCSPKTRELLLKLDELIKEKLEVDGPHWGQKYYVSYKIGNYLWLRVNTRASVLQLNFVVKSKTFAEQDLAQRLGFAQYSNVQSQAEKMNLGNSVFVEESDESRDYIRLRIKDKFDMQSKPFLEFLEQAYKAFPK
ncbi:MAG TPA: hypothetical protein VEG44_06290 [Candidatus Acidoferrales bacterium]|nr:hypothetical protein [Candidatus Acidoferrales bacterium]